MLREKPKSQVVDNRKEHKGNSQFIKASQVINLFYVLLSANV